VGAASVAQSGGSESLRPGGARASGPSRRTGRLKSERVGYRDGVARARRDTVVTHNKRPIHTIPPDRTAAPAAAGRRARRRAVGPSRRLRNPSHRPAGGKGVTEGGVREGPQAGGRPR
jgi:hypothetical protein